MISTDAYRHMFQAVKTGRIEKIIASAYQILQHPVIFTDASFRKVTQVYPAEKTGDPKWDCYLEGEELDINVLKAFLEHDYARTLQIPGIYYYNEGYFKDSAQLCASVINNGRIEGYVTILCPEEDYSVELVSLLEIVADAVLIYLRNDLSRFAGVSTLYTAFVRALFTGSFTNLREAQEMASQLNIKFAPSFIFLVISFREKNVRTFNRYLSDMLNEAHMPLLISPNESNINILLYGQPDHEYNNSSVNRLIDLSQQLGYSCGISLPFSDLSELTNMRTQAERSLLFGKSANLSEKALFYRHLSLEIIIDSAINELGRLNCIHPALLYLKEYDLKYATDYLQTLRMYLRYMGKSAEICEVMHIHRNTLNYRINKIEHLTGIDLGSQYVCTLLNIGLMILSE